MLQPIKVIDLVYCHHREYRSPEEMIRKQVPALGFAGFIDQAIRLQFVKHLDYEGTIAMDGVGYTCFRGGNSFFHLPFRAHRYMHHQHPDVVIVEGFIFPIQLLLLRMTLGRRCRILIQHHGEQPFRGLKGFLQRIACNRASAFLFTALGNAEPWIRRGIVKRHKCHELLEASTTFCRRDRAMSRQRTGVEGRESFLWVGRLNAGKDPLTVLQAFDKHLAVFSQARLYMIFPNGPLNTAVQQMVSQKERLCRSVQLVGAVAHEELPWWYSAADFFLSGSHREGSGYALLEAMACGCIPVVTNIPTFRKITGNGKYGKLYPAGDAEALERLLADLHTLPIDQCRQGVEEYFNNTLHFKNIAADLSNILQRVVQ